LLGPRPLCEFELATAARFRTRAAPLTVAGASLALLRSRSGIFSANVPPGVAQVQPGSAAEQAGLKKGDVITALNGAEVNEPNVFRNLVAGTAPGTDVTLTATPPSGGSFTGWSESSCGSNLNCTIPITADKSVTSRPTRSNNAGARAENEGARMSPLYDGSGGPFLLHHQILMVRRRAFAHPLTSFSWRAVSRTMPACHRARIRDPAASVGEP